MSFPGSHFSGSDGPPKVPIPRIESRRHHQVSRKAGPPQRDRVLIACTGCRERKVRCDGGQPQCRNCLDTSRPCVYLESRKSRLKTATKQNQDMAKLLKQLRISVSEGHRQQIDILLDHVKDDISDAAATVGLDPSSDTEDKFGESAVSADVGSNDETDMLDDETLHDTDGQATGYIGKSSEVQWLRRLQQEVEHPDEAVTDPGIVYGSPGAGSSATKQRMEALKQRQRHKSQIPTSTSTLYLDSEGIEMDYTVEPYKLPSIEVAQRLLDRYMSTVQDLFPVLQKQSFTDQVRQYYASMAQGTPYHVPEKWLAILNLVLAIGARYSHLTEADWQADSRDHVIFQSRAHMLNLDEPSLVHQPDMMRVQITALYAFYSSTVGNVNRAWVAIGIALRYALALGLHLRNEDDSLTIGRKESLVHVWWALYTLEASMSIIVGRPSLVNEDYYSTPLPLPVSAERFRDEAYMSLVYEQVRGAGLYDKTSEPRSATSEPSNAGSFLKCMAHISMIAQRAMIGLYAARVTAKSWKNIQGTIAGLYDELETWAATLPSGLSFLQQDNGTNFMRERVILQMNYIRVKILIARPCLCRSDSRIPDQAKASSHFNHQMARICVDAAKTFTDLLPDHTNVAYLYQIGPWWSMVHHVMQVLTVLLLEVSFDMVHLPDEGREILAKIKTLARWLRVLKEKDRVAGRAYEVAFSVLQGLASRAKVDISEVLQEDMQDSSFPMIPTPQSQTMVESQETENLSSMGKYTYDNPTMTSSMFAIPTDFLHGDQSLPDYAGPTGNVIQSPYPPFGNPFDNVHDERNHPSFDDRRPT